ncbi:MAG: hypothetical protein CVV21_01490 [Candidatus Goldiibacteriota bacterium HGW-Goldbacteria-1]|jgi:hypothetical protein|nr:MAG: hypothetical protein CVV21_01490 [Candidatus Goldiibacteriota bacterium HGW-Goldbacteria-1]
MKKKTKYLFLICFFVLALPLFLLANGEAETFEVKSKHFGYLTSVEYKKFSKQLMVYFEEKGDAYRVSFKEGCVYGPGSMVYGLENVAQIYHQADENEKDIIIAGHFDKIFTSEKEEKIIKKNISDYEKIKSYLAVRIVPNDYLERIGKENAIFREDLTGTYTMLVFDLPSKSMSIKPESAKKWKKDTSELIKSGIENTIIKYPAEVSKRIILNDLVMWYLLGGEIFTTTNIFKLDRYKGCVGKHGALVIVPNRHAIITYPINNKGVLKAVNVLIPMAKKMYDEGPGSISSELYWYYNKKFVSLPFDTEKSAFYPPAEFTAMLNKITENK